MPESKPVRVTTDGACSGNPGPGGWACLIRTESEAWELSGGEADTTNNRMEMLAALRALESLPPASQVELTTDSQYLKNGITTWIHGWMRKGWRTASGEPVKNEDLWRDLWEQTCQHQVEWSWVRGHTGHADNERCDRLAVAAVERARIGDTRERRDSVGGTPTVAAVTRAKAKSAPPADPPSPTVGRNVELKLYCRALEDVKRRAGTLGGRLQPRLIQDDHYLTCADGGRLKLRSEIVNQPDGAAQPRAELIHYHRPSEAGARLSSYTRQPVLDVEKELQLLEREHGPAQVVSKSREVVLLGRTRLHLDRVAGLGFFVELECVLAEGEDPGAAHAELEKLVKALGLQGLPTEARGYAELLAALKA